MREDVFFFITQVFLKTQWSHEWNQTTASSHKAGPMGRKQKNKEDVKLQCQLFTDEVYDATRLETMIFSKNQNSWKNTDSSQ